MRSSLVLLLAVLPSLTVAQECPELEALRALYGIRQMLMEPYVSEYSVAEWIDESINLLRDPLPDGGYRWLRYSRPGGEGPIVKREHLVASDYQGGDRDRFEAEADHPFAVRVVVPRKRALLKANKQVFIGNVTIRYRKDGVEKVLEKPVNAWLAPDTSRSFDLGTIADSAEVTVETATRRANVKNALAEVHFRQAVAQDDPENPNYDTIAALKRIRGSVDPVTVDLEIAKLERRVFPEVEVIPVTTIGVRLREAEKLVLSENEEDQIKGKKILAELIRSLPR